MTSFVHNKCKYSGWGREREGGREGEREERESTTMYCTVRGHCLLPSSPFLSLPLPLPLYTMYCTVLFTLFSNYWMTNTAVLIFFIK